MLEVADLHAGYSGSRVINGVSLHIASGEMVALLGRNGSGKTTLIKTILGLTQRYGGSIRWFGRDLRGWPTYRIVREGIAYVPEDRSLFPSLTVEENLLAVVGKRKGPFAIRDVYEWFPRLSERRGQIAARLSGGERQMLSLARALLTHPRLILIDEFSEGLQPSVVVMLAHTLQRINEMGVSMLVVEQNIHMALRICHRAYVLEKGRVVMEGSARDLGRSEEALKRHLVI